MLDGEQPEWRIPAERMKMREAHIVPLARQSIKILRELHPITGRQRYVFPAIGGAAVLAERRQMMQEWSDYLDRLRADAV
jgi:integrase